MTNAQAIVIGFGMLAAAIFFSNFSSPVTAQSAAPVIPPVEALVPAGESGGSGGPWHLWRMNRHTGQLSFCTAEISTPQSGQSSPPTQPVQPTVNCTKTSSAM